MIHEAKNIDIIYFKALREFLVFQNWWETSLNIVLTEISWQNFGCHTWEKIPHDIMPKTLKGLRPFCKSAKPKAQFVISVPGMLFTRLGQTAKNQIPSNTSNNNCAGFSGHLLFAYALSSLFPLLHPVLSAMAKTVCFSDYKPRYLLKKIAWCKNFNIIWFNCF